MEHSKNRNNYSARISISALTMLVLIISMFSTASAQSILQVHTLGPALGNATSGEVAVVNSTGLVYVSGQSAFGGNIGVLDPTTNSLLKVIRPANLASPASMFYSRVHQGSNIVYFAYTSSPNAQIMSVDGRPASQTFNSLLPPVVFTNQNLVTFAIDQSRNLLYAATRNNTGTQGQVHVIDINPSNGTFHQILATIAMPAGQAVGHIAVNTSTNKVYIATSSTGGGVFVMDGILQIPNFIAGTVPSGPIAINSVSNTVFAGQLVGNFIQAIDGAADTLTINIPIPGRLSGTTGENIAINNITEKLYASLGDGSVAVIDTRRPSPTFNTAVANIPGVGVGFGAVVSIP